MTKATDHPAFRKAKRPVLAASTAAEVLAESSACARLSGTAANVFARSYAGNLMFSMDVSKDGFCSLACCLFDPLSCFSKHAHKTAASA